MAKEYAKRFYASKAWRDTQKAYMQSKHYVCERCGKPAVIVHHKTYISPKNINDPNIEEKGEAKYNETNEESDDGKISINDSDLSKLKDKTKTK